MSECHPHPRKCAPLPGHQQRRLLSFPERTFRGRATRRAMAQHRLWVVRGYVAQAFSRPSRADLQPHFCGHFQMWDPEPYGLDVAFDELQALDAQLILPTLLRRRVCSEDALATVSSGKNLHVVLFANGKKSFPDYLQTLAENPVLDFIHEQHVRFGREYLS